MNLEHIPTPCYVLDRGKLRQNLRILDSVQQRTGCRILLALKSFAMFSVFPLIRETLKGVCASSPNEARLGREEFGGEIHAFAPAYSEADVRELAALSDHIVFNSLGQWRRYRHIVESASRSVACGCRVNPECSTGRIELYDPCAAGSRLGIRREQLNGASLDGLTGLHFHTLCEQNADALEITLKAVERKFGDLISGMTWVNFGGGHHITRDDYDVGLLCRLIEDFQKKYGVQVYLEPGEAVVLNAGVLAATVLDIVHNEVATAILDTSASAHMPDILEMPYRPTVTGAGRPGEKPHTFRLASVTCMAGDVMGDYSFDAPLERGQKILFEDMAHYTMVKTSAFNGIRLPAIAVYDPDDGTTRVVREFGYDDFKRRLS